MDECKEKSIQVMEDAEVSSSAGYERLIKAGSLWEYVGSISKGHVYKSANSIFTIEGSNVHEAYLVIQDGRLTGFYLPVERVFSEAKQQIPLHYITTHKQRSKL